ncbi:MAG: DUF3089 domain-containing protein [Bacteroidota bacterium]
MLTRYFFPGIGLLLLLASGCRSFKCPPIPFAAAPVPAPPDYAQLEHWAAHPAKADRADSVPGTDFHNRQAGAAVDVFFVHPTTFFSKKAWNADLKDEKLNRQTENSAIRHQASIFNGIGRIYAPRYRQMTYGGFLATENPGAADTAYVLAYRDVRAAFRHYLKYENQGRPFLIAGHSQGSAHAIRLIREEIEPTATRQQLITAYLVGWPVRQDTFATLPPCSTPEATGCFSSWCTIKWGHAPDDPHFFRNAVCVNPVTWRTDTVPSPTEAHRGVIAANYKQPYPQRLRAQVRDSYLWSTKPKVPGSWLIWGHNFHIADYNMFWVDVRENVALRVARFLETQ